MKPQAPCWQAGARPSWNGRAASKRAGIATSPVASTNPSRSEGNCTRPRPSQKPAGPCVGRLDDHGALGVNETPLAIDTNRVERVGLFRRACWQTRGRWQSPCRDCDPAACRPREQPAVPRRQPLTYAPLFPPFRFSRLSRLMRFFPTLARPAIASGAPPRTTDHAARCRLGGRGLPSRGDVTPRSTSCTSCHSRTGRDRCAPPGCPRCGGPPRCAAACCAAS